MLKILIVDDSEKWRLFHKNTIENVLGRENIIIQEANSAKEGYEKVMYADKNPFDVIISDLQMESDFAPMSAGEWFVRNVKNFRSHLNTKILIISGMYNIEMIANDLNVDFISKSMLLSNSELPFQLAFEEMGIIEK
jgi:DNA-binding NtrC family response regulator